MNIPFDGKQLGELDRRFVSCEALNDSELLALAAFMWHLHACMSHGRHLIYAQFYATRYETVARCCIAKQLMTPDQLWKQP